MIQRGQTELKTRQELDQGNMLTPSKYDKENQTQFIMTDIFPLRITQKNDLPYYSPAYLTSTPTIFSSCQLS